MERDDDRETWKRLRGWRRKSEREWHDENSRGIKAAAESCREKIRFRDTEEARDFLHTLYHKIEHPNAMRIYKCPVCRGYHTAKIKEKKKMTFQHELQELGGLWQYRDGARYLALLASGKISDTFVNTGVLTTRPDRLEFWGECLARNIRSEFPTAVAQLAVVGPGMGGITLAYEIARNIHTHSGTHAFFTEPQDVNGVKEQKFRFDLPAGASVLLVEDVITTGGSVQKTLGAVCEKGRPEIIPIVGCLVDRRVDGGPLFLSTQDGPLPIQVVSLLSISPRTWDTLEQAQKDRPSAVEAIRPKANWKQLIEG